MSARRGRGRRGRRGHAEEHENEERWLLTYSDMITLLMALFMVLFSISAVNKSKYETLRQALQEAFSGKILSGGKAVMETGSSDSQHQESPESPWVVVPSDGTHEKEGDGGAQQREQREFERLKRRIDAYARAHGLESQIQTEIARRGLVIRVLTDKILFDSGQATIKPPALGLLDQLAQLLQTDEEGHPVVVEGYTDNVPVRIGAAYPSNWELSTARASAVVRFFIADGVPTSRLAAAGYAELHPLATNSTPEGRARNRRVEIVLQRLNPGAGPADSFSP